MRAVCRGAGGRAGRDRRQLLRAGRRQHHVDPAGEPGAQGGAGDHGAGGVPASDGCDAGRRLRAAVEEAASRLCGRCQPAACRRRRSCIGCCSAAVRSIGSTRRCCCRCRRVCGRSICSRRCRRCSIITMRCGCALRLASDSADGMPSRSRRAVRSMPRRACGASTLAVWMTTARRERIAQEAQAAESRLAPAAGVMLQAVWFDAGAAQPGRLLLTIHHLVGRRGVVAHPGARSGGGVAGDRERAAAGAAAARHFVPPLCAAACGACAAAGAAAANCRSGRRCSSRLRCRWLTAGLIRVRDVAGTRRSSDADAAGCADGGAADAGAGGVPWRHQRCAADRPGAGGRGLVPAAWPHGAARSGREPCGAAGSGRPRPRGDVRGRRSVAHGGLVHQPVPGAARSWRCCDLDAALARRRGAGPRAQDASRSSCARCRTTGIGYGLLRYLNAETGAAACRLCGAADRLQLSRPGGGGRRRRTGPLPTRRCGLAAAIRRCRLAMASRSMRTRSMARRARG